jgi:hypothetical protein
MAALPDPQITFKLEATAAGITATAEVPSFDLAADIAVRFPSRLGVHAKGGASPARLEFVVPLQPATPTGLMRYRRFRTLADELGIDVTYVATGKYALATEEDLELVLKRISAS